jgi:hypothetical protein
VRLWFLTHPRDAWEAINFPGLTTAPCLPDQAEVREVLRHVAAAADERPHRGGLPASAGRLRVAPDEGISITQPGDRHLIQVGERVLGRSLTLPGFTGPVLAGQDVFIYTEIPPAETHSSSLSLATSGAQPFEGVRTGAGGLDVLLLPQAQGRTWISAEVQDLRRIATELNRDPFLGQPGA